MTAPGGDGAVHDHGLDSLDTPALVVDLDVMEANLASLASLARSHGLALRPHAKSHKIPAIAWMQVRAGAAGITCQKLGEAEVMSEAGLTDLLVATPIAGSIKVQRFRHLARRARLTTVVDSAEGAAALSEALSAEGMMVDALLEIDVGYHRGGVTPHEAPALARRIAGQMSGLRLAGLMAYEGHLYDLAGTEAVAAAARKSYDALGEVAQGLRQSGHAIDRVSVGASAAANVAAEHPAVTELRAGSYLFNDLSQVAMGSADLRQCALTVLATVVSTPAADRAVIDAGAKALTHVTLPSSRGYGRIVDHEDSTIERISDEHGIISVPAGARPFQVGERVKIIPNSHTVVVNQFAELVGVRRGRLEYAWPVAARGKMQ